MTAAFLGTLFAEAILLTVGVLTGSLAARLLLPEGRGALAAVIFWPQLLAGIGLLSLNQAVTYRIGVNPARARTITATALWLSLILACVTTVAGYLLVPGLLGADRAHMVPIAYAYLFAFVPFNFLTLVLIGEDQGRLDFRRYNGLRLVVPSSYLLALVSLWALDAVSISTVAAANCAATALGGLLRAGLDGAALSSRPSITEAKVLLRWALWAHPAVFLAFFTTQADRFVVLLLWGDIAVGHYVIAFTVATSGLAVVTGAFHRVLFPSLAHTTDRQARVSALRRGLCCSGVLLLALSIPLAAALPWVVPILYGQEFQDAVVPALVLVGAYLLVAIKTIITQSFLALGDGRSSVAGEAIALLLFFGIMMVLGDRLGLAGVGVALGLSNIAALTYLGNRLGQCYGIRVRTLCDSAYEMVAEVSRYIARSSTIVARSGS